MIGLAVRQIWRGALVVAVATGAMSAAVVAGHRDFLEGAGAGDFAALAGNPAIRVMFGEPVALDDAGGFTVWRTGASVAVLVSVWALLAATRVTRGEEESRRWDLLLTGPVTLAGAVARHAMVLAVAACLPGVAVSAALVAAGTDARGAVLHGAGIALIGVFFALVGVLAGQLFASRSQATGSAVAVLILGFFIRMAADAGESTVWLHWTSPFGLLALTRSFASDRATPLFVLVVATAATAFAIRASAGRRDLHGGVFPSPGRRSARRWMLGSPMAFAVRRTLPSWSGWTAGLGVYFLVMAALSGSVTDFLTSNPRFSDLAAEAGFASLETTEGFAATLYTLLAVPVGAFAAVRIATVATGEAQGRFTLTLAAPVTRGRLLATETAAALIGSLAMVTVAGLAAWGGTTTGKLPLTWTSTLAGAWNVTPIVLLSLGFAVTALGWSPRAVAAMGLLPGAGGFLLLVTARSAGAPEWMVSVSPFAHIAAVPLEPFNAAGAAGMVGIAGVAFAFGAWGFRRRDLRT